MTVVQSRVVQQSIFKNKCRIHDGKTLRGLGRSSAPRRGCLALLLRSLRNKRSQLRQRQPTKATNTEHENRTIHAKQNITKAHATKTNSTQIYRPPPPPPTSGSRGARRPRPSPNRRPRSSLEQTLQTGGISFWRARIAAK